MSFCHLIADAERRADGFSLDVPKAWHQGRTAYGGFSAAACVAAAIENATSELPPLRSAQFAMMAPVNGEIDVSAKVIRKGRNATWMSAEIISGGTLSFTASMVFMSTVESALHINDCAVPEGLVPVAEARAVSYSDHTPAFLRNHFETRHAVPASAAKAPEMCRWVRLRERETLHPMVELILLGDALPPGVMPLMTAWVPVSTMHWQVNLLTPTPETHDGWFLLRSNGDYAEKGCSSQGMAIWNPAGAPIMAGIQSVALFG